MQQAPHNHVAGGSLRLVFNDAVFSCPLPNQPTFGDVAATLDGLCGKSGCHPMSIAVTLPKPQSIFEKRN